MTESLIVEREDALALARTEPPLRDPPKRVPIVPYEQMTPEQQARYDRLTALVEAAAPFRVPGATSDHSDMYDEYGLPI